MKNAMINPNVSPNPTPSLSNLENDDCAGGLLEFDGLDVPAGGNGVLLVIEALAVKSWFEELIVGVECARSSLVADKRLDTLLLFWDVALFVVEVTANADVFNRASPLRTED